MKALLEDLAELLRYPGSDYTARIAQAARHSQGGPCHEDLRALEERIGALPALELQELFTSTFDLQPTCSLEVGWHLYGEDYARGSFLAYMRALLSERGLDERGELPDHLANVLAAIVHTPHETSEELREGAAKPALEKMLKAFEDKPNPYVHLLRATAAAVRVPIEGPVSEGCHV